MRAHLEKRGPSTSPEATMRVSQCVTIWALSLALSCGGRAALLQSDGQAGYRATGGDTGYRATGGDTGFQAGAQ
jgi:hypothetical protein